MALAVSEEVSAAVSIAVKYCSEYSNASKRKR